MTDVKGYTPLSDLQKEIANEGKLLEERHMRWLERYMRWLDSLEVMSKTTTHGFDQRAISLEKKHIQTGAIWAIRSIFQPQRIKLPEDTA